MQTSQNTASESFYRLANTDAMEPASKIQVVAAAGVLAFSGTGHIKVSARLAEHAKDIIWG